jgi:hypothetical protein
MVVVLFAKDVAALFEQLEVVPNQRLAYPQTLACLNLRDVLFRQESEKVDTAPFRVLLTLLTWQSKELRFTLAERGVLSTSARE